MTVFANCYGIHVVGILNPDVSVKNRYTKLIPAINALRKAGIYVTEIRLEQTDPLSASIGQHMNCVFSTTKLDVAK